jgi:hypothetical protein
MQIFRAAVAIAWLAVMWISVQAVTKMGFDAAGATFFADFAHPWRAQFNGDFGAHLLLMASWIAYRERRLAVGLPLALAAVMLGGAFSFAYIFVATFRARGSFTGLLLGDRAPA